MKKISDLEKPIEWLYKYVQWEIKEADFFLLSKEFYNKLSNKNHLEDKYYILCPHSLSNASKLGVLLLNEFEKQSILKAVRIIMLISQELNPDVSFIERLQFCQQYFGWNYKLTSNDIFYNKFCSELNFLSGVLNEK